MALQACCSGAKQLHHCVTHTPQVFACEWNPNAVEALRRGLEANGVAHRCVCVQASCASFSSGLDYTSDAVRAFCPSCLCYAKGMNQLAVQPPTLGSGLHKPDMRATQLQPTHRCEVRQGDCRQVAPKGVADRVLLGLLPSAEGGWATAVAALKEAGEAWKLRGGRQVGAVHPAASRAEHLCGLQETGGR